MEDLVDKLDGNTPEQIAYIEHDRDIGYFAYPEREVGNPRYEPMGIQIPQRIFILLLDTYKIPTVEDYYAGKRRPK
jgi:hypothetical protein